MRLVAGLLLLLLHGGAGARNQSTGPQSQAPAPGAAAGSTWSAGSLGPSGELDSRRKLTEVTVSTFGDLKYQIMAGSASTIRVASGTYTCSGSSTSSASGSCYGDEMLRISRDVAIIADSGAGTVVLDAQGSSSNQKRVLRIQSGYEVELDGIDITGGYTTSVSKNEENLN